MSFRAASHECGPSEGAEVVEDDSENGSQTPKPEAKPEKYRLWKGCRGVPRSTRRGVPRPAWPYGVHDSFCASGSKAQHVTGARTLLDNYQNTIESAASGDIEGWPGTKDIECLRNEARRFVAGATSHFLMREITPLWWTPRKDYSPRRSTNR